MLIVLLIASVLASTAHAASGEYLKLPNCARPAFLRAAGYSDCALTDTSCICNTEQLLTQFKDVIPQACPGQEFAEAYKIAREICPNLSNIYPSAENPILRIPRTANVEDYKSYAPEVTIQTQPPAPIPNPPPPVATGGSRPTPLEPQPYAPYGVQDGYNHPDNSIKHDGPGQDGYNRPDTSIEHDEPGQDEDVPVPYTTPANFAASVTATLKPEDFGNTETWRYPNGATPPPNVSKTSSVKTPSATGVLATGEAVGRKRMAREVGAAALVALVLAGL